MTYEEFSTQWERMPYGRRLTLQRQAGFSESDPRHHELLSRAAVVAGLPPSAPAVEVLYARQYGAVGCPSCGGRCEAEQVGQEGPECVAVEFSMGEIHLDPKRFQNRVDAFSELSAEAVAQHYDPNKFDPVVLWRDPAGKAWMLSGHSRHEGMKRRQARTIPARFFRGTEAEAIQFARVDANRAATAESVAEDLKAYRLMRDGDRGRDLAPAKKSELARAFRGKVAKLEAWSHLDPGGLFVGALSQDNRSEFPYVEKFALWVGQLRAKHGAEFTNTHESDCFNFFYGEGKNLKLSREDFEELAEKRLSWGKPRLFPECSRDGCADLQDLAKRGHQASAYRELEALAKLRETITQRLRSTDRALRVYTDAEREKLKEQGQLVDQEVKRLRRDLGQAEAAPALFGPGDVRRDGPRYFPGLSIEPGDFRDLEDMLYLIRQHLEAVGFNDQDKFVAFRLYADEKKVARLLLDLDAVGPQIVVTAPLPVYVVALPRQFFGLVDSLLRQRRVDYQYQLPK